MDKNKGKIISLAVLVVVLVALIVTLIIITNNQNHQSKTANSTVEMSVNQRAVSGGESSGVMALSQKDIIYSDKAPVVYSESTPTVELVVSENNKVLSVNYKNTDAEIIFSDSELIGKNIEEVAKMFVEQATKAGYIDVNTDGTTVTITVNGKVEKDIKAIEDKVIAKVNEYFDENGIIAGAVASVKDDVSAKAEEMGVTAKKYYLMLKAQALDPSLKLEDLKDETAQELMDRINASVKEYEGIAYEKREALEAKYNELYNEMVKQKENVLSFLNIWFDASKESYDQILAQIKESKLIPDETKTELINKLEGVKASLNSYEQAFKTNYEEFVKTVKKESEDLYKNYKEQLNARIESAKLAIEEHKAQFEKDKAEIEKKIEDFRKSLVATQK